MNNIPTTGELFARCKQKAANKIDGIVALAMACLQAVQTSNRAPLVIAAI